MFGTIADVDITGLTLTDLDEMREIEAKERAARAVPNAAATQ
jgi:hypothetical protein